MNLRPLVGTHLKRSSFFQPFSSSDSGKVQGLDFHIEVFGKWEESYINLERRYEDLESVEGIEIQHEVISQDL